MNRKMQVAALLGATMLGTSAWAQETDEIIVLSSPFKKAASKVISTTEILTAEDIEAQIDGPLGNLGQPYPVSAVPVMVLPSASRSFAASAVIALMSCKTA